VTDSYASAFEVSPILPAPLIVPQVYGCCSVDQVSSHRDYRELLGYDLSKFARRITTVDGENKILN